MGWAFWGGILIGFFLTALLTVVFWTVTTRVLVPRLKAHDPRILGSDVKPGDTLKLQESENEDGTWSYRFNVSNIGRRHAIDVEFSCTMFSTGWASDPARRIATIALPVTTGRIGIMPAHRSARNRKHPLTFVGARVVTFTTKITEFQARKLPGECQQDARDGKIRLGDLMALGTGSVLSVTVYAFDSFSGSRTVFTEGTATAADILQAYVP